MFVVEVENLSFSYKGEHPVLEEVSFKVEKGDFVGIIGPNGGGKTTLLKVILGLLRPSKGSVKLFGKDVNYFSDWKRIGYIPQRVRVKEDFPATASEILQLSDAEEKLQEIINFLHLEDILTKKFVELSGGQQQLVLLGSVLAEDPDLLVLDEPTVGLDIHARRHIMEILRDVSSSQEKTVLMVSHDLGGILEVSDKVLCLDGRVQYFGPPEEALHIIEELFGLGEWKERNV